MAQTFDATGPAVPPSAPHSSAGVFTRGGRPVGVAHASVQIEGAYDLLARETTDGPYGRVSPVVESLFGLRLGGAVPLSERMGLVFHAPFWLDAETEVGAGAALGDVQVGAPFALWFDRERHGLTAGPVLTLPTGARARYLGGPGSVGIALSGFARRGWFVANLDVEASVVLGASPEDWKGTVMGSMSGSFGLAGERFGVHLEGRSWGPLGRLETVPSEAMLSVRGAAEERLWLSLAGGAAVTRGAGAAAPRFDAGLTWAFSPKEAPETVGLSPAKTSELHVVNEEGLPVQGVEVLVGNQLFSTDGEGFVDVPTRLLSKTDTVQFRHPKFTTSERGDFDVEASFWEVELVRKPIPVLVSVVGPDGEPMLDGRVELRSLEGTSPPVAKIDALGRHGWHLAPGTRWVAVSTADQMGGQARVIDIPRERTEAIRIDVLLDYAVDPSTKLAIQVTDGVGEPVEDAAVAVDDRDFGTTGPGGMLEIEGLPRGLHSVTVRSSHHGEAFVASVEVGDDSNVGVTLDWPPGAVVVRVADEKGAPLDARVRMRGPVSLPARSVGSDGQEMFVLRPGAWTLVVDAPGRGGQERTVEVTATPGEWTTLDVVLQPEETGEGALVVRVRGSRGEVLEGIDLELDGRAIGRTDGAGQLVLLGLSAGPHDVLLKGDAWLERQMDVEVLRGRQIVDVVLQPRPGLRRLVTHLDGVPVSATLQDSNDPTAPAIEVDGSGRTEVVLEAGTYTMDVEVEGRQVQRTIVVEDDTTFLDIGLGEGTAGVEVRTVDEAGEALPNAEVRVDGEVLGTTDSTGVLVVQALSDGEVEIEVEADGEVRSERVVLGAGVAEVELSMPSSRRVEPVGLPADAEVVVRGEEGVVSHTLDGGALQLTEGTYEVEVRTSEGASLVELVVPEGEKASPVLQIDGEPSGVVVAVEGRNGSPVVGAEVLVDGQVVGRTGTFGTLVLESVEPSSEVEVRTERETSGRMDLEHVAGRTLVIEQVGVGVEVAVIGADDAPVEATVTVVGMGESLVTTPEGLASLDLPAGEYLVTARSGRAMAAQPLTIPPVGEIPMLSLKLLDTTTEIVEGKLVLVRPLLFATDSSSLDADARAILDDVARLLLVERTAALVEVAGHTDDVGGVAYNQQLSERRAQAVLDGLVDRGVERERLLRRGYGLSRPIVAGEAGRQSNRRVELVIVESSSSPTAREGEER